MFFKKIKKEKDDIENNIKQLKALQHTLNLYGSNKVGFDMYRRRTEDYVAEQLLGYEFSKFSIRTIELWEQTDVTHDDIEKAIKYCENGHENSAPRSLTF